MSRRIIRPGGGSSPISGTPGVTFVPPGTAVGTSETKIFVTAILDLSISLTLIPKFEDGSKELLGSRVWAPDSVEDWADPGLDSTELARYFWWAKDNGRLSDGTTGFTWK